MCIFVKLFAIPRVEKSPYNIKPILMLKSDIKTKKSAKRTKPRYLLTGFYIVSMISQKALSQALLLLRKIGSEQAAALR